MEWGTYAKFGSTVIWDRAALQSYWEGGIGPRWLEMCGPECDPYTAGDCSPAPLPVPTDADWYDPLLPISLQFAGLLVTNIIGTDSTWSRGITERATGDGGVFGRGRRTTRKIEVEGYLIGQSCCAVAYGLRWLARALQDPYCGAENACGGTTLTVMDCCAAVPEERYRTLFDVALTDGPHIAEDTQISCGCGCATITKVRFTLTAGNPSLWLSPTEVITEATLETGVPVCEWCEPECVTTDCADDPDCPEPDPPALPVIANDCVCWPLIRRKHCAAVTVPNKWRDAAIIATVTAGAEALRNLRLDFFANPAGQDCDEIAGDACNRCASLAVTYVPPYSTLTVDGRTRTVTLVCQGAERSGDRNIGSGTGGTWTFPILDCTPYCVCWVADDRNSPADATVSVSIAAREL